jgi:hypothetical protein
MRYQHPTPSHKVNAVKMLDSVQSITLDNKNIDLEAQK